eukprot:jgi/Mesvir1/15757/Mv03329-RA.1
MSKSGETPLHLASRQGSLDVVKHLIAIGADIGARKKNEDTALHEASRQGHLAVVQHLIANGADVESDKRGQTPLHVASENGQVDVVKHLLASGANKEARTKTGSTPLQLASINNRLGVARHLVKSGATKEATTKSGWSALHYVSNNGHLDIAELLVARGADVEAKTKMGWTPLYLASLNGHEDVVQHLIASGADEGTRCTHVSEATKDVRNLAGSDLDANAKNMWGITPLHTASEEGNVQIVKLLIARGADVKAKNWNDATPLHLASAEGHLDVVKHLIKVGAQLEATTKNGNTTLHWASHFGRVEVVRHLVGLGANVKAKNQDGMTPLDLAKKSNFQDVTRCLRELKFKTQQEPQAPAKWTTDESLQHSTPGSRQVPVGRFRRFDLFLSHNWGLDNQGRDNHKRVTVINAALQAKGFTTWFDGQRMTGSVEKEMFDGIDGAGVVVIFLTRRYMEKIEREGDNCAKEFQYAARNKEHEYIVPVVMESELQDPAAWTDTVANSLTFKEFVPMVTDREIETNLGKLVDMLAEVHVEPKQ